ncbi:hypothetical protein ACWGCP_22135 [Streptomyces niveus]
MVVGTRRPADTSSIDALLEAAGPLDAIVCCAASGAMTPLSAPSDDEFWTGLDGKLIGQVNLVRRSLTHVRDGGSLTLTSGRFADPVPGSSLGHLSTPHSMPSSTRRRPKCRAVYG